MFLHISVLTEWALKKKKKKKIVDSGCCSKRERKVFSTEAEHQGSQRGDPFGETKTSSKTREGNHSDPSNAWPGDTRAGGISKADFSVDGSCKTK